MRATQSFINPKIIKGIAAFFILLISGLLIYSITQIKLDTSGSAVALPSFHLTFFFNSTYLQVAIMINIVLGLMLLDYFFRGYLMRIK